MQIKAAWSLVTVCTTFLVLPSVIAQLPTATPFPTYSPPYAIITYPSTDPNTPGVSVTTPCMNGIFALVGLQPDQAVQVTVQYPTNQALEIVNVQAVDGGIILPPTVTNNSVPPTPSPSATALPSQPSPQVALSLVISIDGTLSFTFKATHDPGRNQIALRTGSQQFGLQFWILDPTDPHTDPVAITPENPYPSAP